MWNVSNSYLTFTFIQILKHDILWKLLSLLSGSIALAEELQLKGLTGSDNSVKDQHFTKASTIKREKQSQAPTFPEDFNADDSEEAQEIIQKLTNQLYTQEDKYVKMKAENLSKDQTIRTLSQSLSKLDGKFQSFKSDRADLVKYST